MEPGGWRWLVAGLGVGCPGPGRVGPGPDICTAQLVQPPPAAPGLHQPHYRLQIDLMVDTFADFTRNSSNEYSVPWSQVWPDSRLSDIDKTGSSHQPGPPLLQSTICYQMTSSQKVNFSVYCDLGPGGY